MAKGYASYTLQKESAAEKRKLEEEMSSKSAWQTIGSGLGSLLAFIPGVGWAAAATLGGVGSLVGRGAMDLATGDYTQGKFYKGARQNAIDSSKFFSEEALTTAATAAITAGTANYAADYAAAASAAKTSATTKAAEAGTSYVGPTAKEIKGFMTDAWAPLDK